MEKLIRLREDTSSGASITVVGLELVPVRKLNRSAVAYKLDVFHNGRYHTLHKRYSEFEELHKQLKKIIPTPEFPPKKMLKFQHKVIEQRRVCLQSYLQGILEGETVPRVFFKFVEVQLPRTGSFDSLDVGLSELAVTHQPMVGFTKDAFLQENYRSILPDIVAQGVYGGLYSTHNDDVVGNAFHTFTPILHFYKELHKHFLRDRKGNQDYLIIVLRSRTGIAKAQPFSSFMELKTGIAKATVNNFCNGTMDGDS